MIMLSGRLLRVGVVVWVGLLLVGIAGGAAQAQDREVRIGTVIARRGQQVVVPIYLTATGNENALGFSLTFNPSVLTNLRVALGNSVPGATFLVNQSAVSSGRIGIVLTQPIGQRFEAGRLQILTLTMVVAAGAPLQLSAITPGDQPVIREVSDDKAMPLEARYIAGGVIVDQTLAIVVQPDTPTINDNIQIEFRGTWNNGCIPGNPVLTRNGTQLRLDTSFNSSVCVAALTDFSVRVSAGRLPAGEYTLEVVYTSPQGSGYLGERGITVIGALTTVNAANYASGPLATESIVAGFGVDLATSTQLATTLPLPTALAGTTIKVRDAAGVERLAPLFFASPQQINYQIPQGTVAGNAQVMLTSALGKVAGGSITIQSVTPGLFTADGSGRGIPAAYVLRARGSSPLTSEQIWQATSGVLAPVPIDIGPETDQLFLVLFGTGIRYRTSLSNAVVRIGGVAAEVLYAGEAPGFVGLDQCNVRIPRSLAGRGAVDLELSIDGQPANVVRITIK